MVAIVAGQGLGLLNTSTNLLGDKGQLGNAALARTGERVYVNASTGNLVIQQQDEWLAGIGPDVGISRTYNSLGTGTDDNGDNWRLGLSRRISAVSGGTGVNTVDSQVTRVAEDGAETVYKWDAGRQLYVSKDGVGAFDSLKYVAGTPNTWVWTDGDSRVVETYEVTTNGQARLKSVANTDGNKLVLTYVTTATSEFLISKIETFASNTGSGETVTIDYYAQTGLTAANIKSITTAYKNNEGVTTSMKRVSYTYETYTLNTATKYRLKTVVVDLTPSVTTDNSSNAAQYVTTYGYWNNTSSLVSSLSHTVNGTPQTVISIGYNGGKVDSITEWASNSITDAVKLSFEYATEKTTIKDTLNRVTELHYETAAGQNLGQLKKIVGPQVSRGEQEQVFEYDGDGNVTKITDGRGLTVEYRYELGGNGNRVYERDAQNNVVHRTYSATNQLLTETVYTDLDPDGEGAGVPTAGLTTRYVYDSKEHLRFVVSAAGLVTEHRYADSGVNKGLRVSMLQYNVARYDISALELEQALTLNSLENWVTALTDKSSMRVDYTYNSRGQLDKQTAFAKVDPATGTGVSDNTQSVSQFVYDQAGNLLQKIDGRGYELAELNTTWAQQQRGILDYSADAGLLTSEQRALLRGMYSSIYLFDGLNRITSSKDPVSQQTTLTTYSSTALQTQVTMTNGLITTSTYDRQGRVLTVARGTSGATTALGTTSYTYNVLGQLTSVTQPTGEKTYYLYDEMGRKVGEIDGEGALTEYTYNANDQLVRTYGYTNKVSPSMLIAVENDKKYGGNIGLPENLISKSMTGWSFSRVSTTATHITNSTSAGAADSGTLEGETTLLIQQTANGSPSESSLTSPSISIKEDKKYAVNLMMGNFNATGQLYIEYLNTSGQRIGNLIQIGLDSSGTNYPGGSNLANYTSQVGVTVAPKGATMMRLIAKKSTSQNNALASKLLITNPVITEVPSGYSYNRWYSDLRPKTSTASDTEEFRIYDKAGRLSKTVKMTGSTGMNAGSAVEYRYDGAGRLTDQLAYSGQLTSMSWLRNTRGDLSAANGTIVTSSGTITLPVDAYNDRRTRYFYDADGRQVGVLDSDNYLSLQGYDAAGRLLYTRKFANAMEGTLADGNTMPAIVNSGTQSPTTGAFVRTSTSDASAGGADQVTRYSYNSKGQLTAVIDPTSYATAYVYDAAGNVIKETRYAKTAVNSSTNAVLLGAFSSDGALYSNLYVNDTHPENRITIYEYDGNNRLTRKLEQPNSLETQYTYDIVGNLTQTVLAIGFVEERELRKQYDKLGRVVAELSAEGAKALVGKTDPTEIAVIWNKYATRHDYDNTGHRIATTEPLTADGTVRKTIYFYDKAGRLTHSVNALGEVTQTVYDSFGHVTQTRRKAVALGVSAVSSWTGGLISSAPSALKDMDWSLDAANSITSYTYDRAGLLASSLTATNSKKGGETSTYFYNAFGELRDFRNPSRIGTRHTYDRRGNITQTDSTLDAMSWRSEETQYDAFGRVFQRTDANGFVTNFRHDKRGRVFHVANQYNSAVVGFSAYGVQTSYDAFDRVIKIIDQMNTQTTYVYDTAARTTTMSTMSSSGDEVIARVTTTYDRLGQTVKVMDKLGNYTTHDYNADGLHKATKRYATDGTPLTEEQTSYDSAGRIDETRDGKGIITRLNYDAANRVLSRVIDAAPGGLQFTTTYIYDGMGRVAWTKDATGSWTYTEYDQDGRVTALVVDPASIPTGTNNALQANPAVGGALALRTELEYDPLGQQIKLIEGAGTAEARTTTYKYDKGGRRYQETVDEGDASTGALNLITKYHYDSNDNVAAKEDAKGQITRYTYNAANQLSHIIAADGSVTHMAYDARGKQTMTTRFAQRINTVSLGMVLTEGEVAVWGFTSDTANQVSYQTYDALQRLHYSINAEGYVTERFYDDVGNIQKVVAYSTPISSDAIEIHETAEGAINIQVTTEPELASDDRTEYTFYDAANRPVWQIDAEGGVTQNTYDKNSRVTQVRRFANPVTKVTTPRTSLPLPAGEVAISGNGLAVDDLIVVGNESKDQITHQVYDNAGRMTWTVDAENYVTKYTYDNNDRLKISTRYNTPLTSYTAGSGAPSPVGHANDAATTNIYDAAGRLTDVQSEVQGAESVTQHTAYDSLGHVTDVTQAYGDTALQVTTHFKYDRAGRLTAETQAYGSSEEATTQYELDEIGQRVKIIDPRGVAEAASHEVGSQAYLDALAAYTTTQMFDKLGRIEQTLDALEGSIFTEYDAFGNAVKVTDPNNNSGYFYFDKNNQSILHIDPEGYAVETTFDAFGQAQTITQLDTKVTATLSTATSPTLAYDPAKDAKTTITHDKLGRQTQIKDAEGYSEYMAYDALGNKTEYTNKLGGKFIYTHDKLGRVITEKQPVQVKELNADGSIKLTNNVATLKDVFTRFTYDSRGNVLTKIEGDGLVAQQRTTTYTYDKLNRVKTTAGEAMTVYDPAANSEGTTTPTETRWYDKRGNLIEIEAADKSRTLTYWDALNRKLAEVNPVGTLTQWDYDDAGQVIVQRIYGDVVTVDANQRGGGKPSPVSATKVRETRYAYDALKRLNEVRVPDITVGELNATTGSYEIRTQDLVSRFEHDTNGNVRAEIDARGNIKRHYFDKVGKEVLRIDEDGYVTRWLHTALTTQQTAYAKSVDTNSVNSGTTFDAIVGLVTDSAEDRITVTTNDRMGRVKKQEVRYVEAYNVNASTGAATPTQPQGQDTATTSYTYDGAGNLLTVQTATSENLDWKYDKQGRNINKEGADFSVVEGGLTKNVRQTHSMEYNALGLLTKMIEEGALSGVSTDDRIVSKVYNKNGYLTKETDAENNETNYLLNANGVVVASWKKRSDIDSAATQGYVDVATYKIDKLGREVEKVTSSFLEKDRVAGTSIKFSTSALLQSSNQTRYNAYGEIEASGEGNGWQRFTEYDARGKIVKSNHEDGVTRAYFNDANGNASLKIESTGADFKNVALDQVLQRSDVHLTVTSHTARNLIEANYSIQENDATQSTDPSNWVLQVSDSQNPISAIDVEGVKKPISNSAVNSSLLDVVHTSLTDYTNYVIRYGSEDSGDPVTGTWKPAMTAAVVFKEPEIFPGVFELLKKPDFGVDFVCDDADATYTGSPVGSWRPENEFITYGNKRIDYWILQGGQLSGRMTIYKNEGGLKVTQAILSFQVVDNGTDKPQFTIQPVLMLKEQPAGTKQVVFMYRARGSNSPWVVQSLPSTGVDLNKTTPDFSFDPSSASPGTYEMRYLAMGGGGVVLNNVEGYFVKTSSTIEVTYKPQETGQAGFSFVDTDGNVNFVMQGANATRAKLSLTPTGGGISTVINMTALTLSNQTMGGWFQLSVSQMASLASSGYSFALDRLAADGSTGLGKVTGSLTKTSATSTLVSELTAAQVDAAGLVSQGSIKGISFSTLSHALPASNGYKVTAAETADGTLKWLERVSGAFTLTSSFFKDVNTFVGSGLKTEIALRGVDNIYTGELPDGWNEIYQPSKESFGFNGIFSGSGRFGYTLLRGGALNGDLVTYKEINGSRVNLSKVAFSIVDNGVDAATLTWAASSPILSITDQPAGTDKLVMMYRVKGSGSAWSVKPLDKVSTGKAFEASSFVFSPAFSGLSPNTYEMRYMAVGYSGEVLNSEMGEFTLTDTSISAYQKPRVAGGFESVFMDTEGYINFIELGSNRQHGHIAITSDSVAGVTFIMPSTSTVSGISGWERIGASDIQGLPANVTYKFRAVSYSGQPLAVEGTFVKSANGGITNLMVTTARTTTSIIARGSVALDATIDFTNFSPTPLRKEYEKLNEIEWKEYSRDPAYLNLESPIATRTMLARVSGYLSSPTVNAADFGGAVVGVDFVVNNPERMYTGVNTPLQQPNDYSLSKYDTVENIRYEATRKIIYYSILQGGSLSGTATIYVMVDGRRVDLHKLGFTLTDTGTSASMVWDMPRGDLIRVDNQPVGTQQVIAMYRHTGGINESSWTVQKLDNYGLNATTGLPQFGFMPLLKDAGEYEFHIHSLNNSGDVLYSEAFELEKTSISAGNFYAMTNHVPFEVGAAGRAVVDNEGGLNFYGLGANAGKAIFQIISQSGVPVYSAPIEMKPSNLANGVPGWFQLNTADMGLSAGNYQYRLQLMDAAGLETLKILGGTLLVNDSAVSIDQPTLQNQLQLVKFNQIPAAASGGKVYFKPKNSTSTPQSASLLLSSVGQMVWDTSAISISSPTDYDIEYDIWDKTGRVLSSGTGVARLRETSDAIVSVTSVWSSDQWVFNAASTAAKKMTLYYGTRGSTSPMNSVVLNVDSRNRFVFNAQAFMAAHPEATAFDYYYTLSTATNSPIVVAPELATGTILKRKSADGEADQSILDVSNSAKSSATRSQYNAFGEITEQTDTRGNITKFTYNTLGKLTKKVEPITTVVKSDGQETRSSPTTAYGYDLQGRLVKITDANNWTTTQRWTAQNVDGESKLAATYQPDGGQLLQRYDRFADLTESINQNWDGQAGSAKYHTTQYAYDKNHRLLSVTKPERRAGGIAAKERYTYDSAGNNTGRYLRNESGAELAPTKNYYDALGRIVKTVTSQDRTTTYSYVDGWSILDAAGNTVIGTKKTMQDANGRTIVDQQDIFGRVYKHKDLGEHEFNYGFNGAGQLVSQTNTKGQNIQYKYYASGLLMSIQDKTKGTLTEYGYDSQKNKVYEYQSNTYGINVTQQTRVAYDELNRIKSIQDLAYQVDYEYDAAGNRRHLIAKARNGYIGGIQDFWYDYDTMNRLSVTMGQLNGVVGAQGTKIIARYDGAALTYDKLGQRIRADFTKDGHSEQYFYTEDGYLETVKMTLPGKYVAPTATTSATLPLASDFFIYSFRNNDIHGRVKEYKELYCQLTVSRLTKTYTYDRDNKIDQEVERRYSTGATESSNVDIKNFYLADGTLDRVDTRSSANSGTLIQTYHGYAWWDSAKITKLQANAINESAPNWKPGVSNISYDVNGNISYAVDTVGKRSFTYKTNAQGIITSRLDKESISTQATYVEKNQQTFYYFNGRRIGEVGTDKKIAIDQGYLAEGGRLYQDFDQNYSPISNNYPEVASGSYTANAGETLASVAMAVFGDSTLWYLIAEVNGLTDPNAALEEGQLLVIPNKVSNVHNTSSTAPVYNPMEAMGDISPKIPPAPPPPQSDDGGCGILGVVLMVFVAVVATAFVSGLLSGASGTFGQIMTQGFSAMQNPLSMSNLGLGGGGSLGVSGAFVAGAAGSAASQLVGKAAGVIEDFSWTSVAMGGFSSMVGGYLKDSAMIPADPVLGGMVRGALGNAITQGIGVATGLQKHFDWRAVAAGAASGGIQGLLVTSPAASFEGFQEHFGAQMLSGAARAAIYEQKPNWAMIAADSFGNALGDAVVGSIAGNDRNNPQTTKVLSRQTGDAGEYLDVVPPKPGSENQFTLPDLDPTLKMGNGSLQQTDRSNDYLLADNSKDLKAPAGYFERMRRITDSDLSIEDQVKWGLQDTKSTLVSGLKTAKDFLLTDIPALVEARESGLNVLRPALHDAYDLSVNPNATFVEQWFATLTVGQMSGMVGTSETMTPTNPLGLGMSVLSAAPAVRGLYSEFKMLDSGLDIGLAVRNTSAAGHEFLSARGVDDVATRQSILDGGLRFDLLDADVTPTTLARFDKLFPQTIAEGKSFSGRLGNMDTRIATVNKAAELEIGGVTPAFEYPVAVGNGHKRFVDLVGLSQQTQKPTTFIQFVKQDNYGNVIRPDELIATKQIENALKLKQGTVKMVNTSSR
jgi:YD repeat-containing protein